MADVRGIVASGRKTYNKSDASPFLFEGAVFMDFRPQEIIMFLPGQCAARVLRRVAELIVRYSGAAPWVGGGS